MRKMSALILLSSMASACGPSPEQVWLFTIGDTTIVESQSSCDENLDAATCPETGGGEESPWTVTSTEEVSPGALFIEILDLPGGEKALVADGEIFVGSKEGGTWSFTWENYENSTDEQRHDSGYVYRQSSDQASTTTFELDIDGANATGTLITELDIERTVAESDSWLSDQVGLFTGQLFDDAPVYLEGDRVNYNDVTECGGGECYITATASSRREAPITGYRTDADHDAYEGVSGAYQSEGSNF